ncbi:hypothetical protein Phi46:3_gp068 [Cellulophaga phage phi46:3]|uniref:Uncharacterized protein n=1 Tax=Cellulophaga phage phi46:3 TaxID=1327985 RepID=S0A2Y2_9CAUD|nr:hypothetical protein Phi46:3_gp068 [Cellulophaga phage phi46:3]AGO48812.1 hypothetical protein Phi46:3_gp068 [Cellulophaga phage phi46:3]
MSKEENETVFYEIETKSSNLVEAILEVASELDRGDVDFEKANVKISSLIEEYREEKEILDLVANGLNAVKFAKYYESLTSVNKISLHPSPRNLSMEEIYDKYTRNKDKDSKDFWKKQEVI